MSQPKIHVVCLCAAWCRLCDDYAPVLRAVVTELQSAGASLQWHWIDIEDEADLVGELDVETFPTLVIFDADHIRFAGALTPQPDTLRRVLRATIVDADADARWPAAGPQFESFAARLRQRATVN